MARVVEPFANISAQELLKNTPRLFNWVRKEEIGGWRSVVNVLEWPRRYMILRTGCLYLYKDSDYQTFCEAIPLTEFRVCDAPEKNKYPWVFKLISTSDIKTLFFAVDSEFDLKKWKDAITDEKSNHCCHTSGNNEDDGYCAIEDKPVSQTPAPAPPSRTQPTRQRPPEPLPQLPKRPHSVSCPDPSIDFTPPRNPLPIPPRRGSSDVPEHPVPQKKPLTLPRPTTPGPKQTRPLTMGRLPRSSTESSLTTQPRGYDNVVNQLANVNLSSADKKGSVSSSRVQGSVPRCKPKTLGRGAPDGQSFKDKHKEGILPTSALRLDTFDKTEIHSLLENEQGVYILRGSQTAQSKMALSVWTGDRVRHYVIFYDEDLGYALQPDGARFHKIEDLLRQYYECNLPKCDVKLKRPYK
ncbi:hypothetical protein OS493_001889 [Desmophyllum pertusum]|uniref:Uncharacterized protein n=1 Tax=Desmophyllum pertusum TaxID=174260 RepID=A0A9W9Z4P6_9CNID|nr:hypothetical protein OS493_001889 [Desmophyllum pertusum]